MQNPPAQEVHQVTFVAVGDVKTDTAQLLTYDGQRTEQEATKISIPGEWSLLLLRGAGTKTGQYSSLILVAYYKMSYKQNTAPQSWFQKSTKITEFGKVYLGSTIVIDHPLYCCIFDTGKTGHIMAEHWWMDLVAPAELIAYTLIL